MKLVSGPEITFWYPIVDSAVKTFITVLRKPMQTFT